MKNIKVGGKSWSIRSNMYKWCNGFVVSSQLRFEDS